MAADGKLDALLSEKEIERVSQILSRGEKNNRFSIGEPGNCHCRRFSLNCSNVKFVQSSFIQ
jgi:hypothetical protein